MGSSKPVTAQTLLDILSHDGKRVNFTQVQATAEALSLGGLITDSEKLAVTLALLARIEKDVPTEHKLYQGVAGQIEPPSYSDVDE